MAVPGADRLQLTPDSTVYYSSINLLSYPPSSLPSSSLFLCARFFTSSSSHSIDFFFLFSLSLTRTNRTDFALPRARNAFPRRLGVSHVMSSERALRGAQCHLPLQTGEPALHFGVERGKIAFNCSTSEPPRMRSFKGQLQKLGRHLISEGYGFLSYTRRV